MDQVYVYVSLCVCMGYGRRREVASVCQPRPGRVRGKDGDVETEEKERVMASRHAIGSAREK